MHDFDPSIYQHFFPSRRRWSLPRILPWRSALVSEHEHALLYRRGRLVWTLPAGLHRLWGRHVEVQRFDRRRQLLAVPTQELPTADGVTVKVTAQAVYSIVDPLALIRQDGNHQQTLYAAAQQAVRLAVVAQTLEQLNGSRPAIALAMREAMAGTCAGIGITVHEAVLKDVMPNAETRRALAAVAIARQEAQAALERARGEQAALRALANAARLIAEQPALAQLKSLQVLAEGLRGGASVVVNAGDAGLVPMRGRTGRE